jgi:hypothetical protein
MTGKTKKITEGATGKIQEYTPKHGRTKRNFL